METPNSDREDMKSTSYTAKHNFANKKAKYNHKFISKKASAYRKTHSSSSLVPRSLPAIVVGNDNSAGAYQAWKMYLPEETYIENSESTRKLKVIEKYLLKILDSKRSELENHQSFTVNTNHIVTDEEVSTVWPEFLTDLRDTPNKVIRYFGLVMHQILYEEKMREFYNQPPDPDVDRKEEIAAIKSMPVIYAKFSGFQTMSFKNLKMNTYKKLVSVKGTVIRVGNVSTMCSKLAFVCNKCKNGQVVLQPNGNYTVPTHCILKQCHSRSFEPLRKSTLTKMMSWQNVRLQELVDDDTSEKGRVPRTIECEFRNDLVDKCVPGDIVTVSGIVEVIEPKEKTFGNVKNKSTYVLYILANFIECLKEKKPDSLEVMPGGLQLNLSDLYAVRQIHDRDDLFTLIVASLCPNIYGHDIIKAGLVLGLFGGTHRFTNDNNRVPVRGDSHVLIVGDPGLGKSQMLLACANVSPRGVYVCGNTSTSSGLTVTVTKEAGGENGLDAGALVLADQGCCCIDEFDKMTNQHHALLEAMEQQTISIAKCGMSCILPARTSIIAAANPVGGHYNKAKTVSENLKLSSALLSRFDLVFIVIDKTDAELDSKLSEHVMAMNAGKSSKRKVQLKDVDKSSSVLLECKSRLEQSLCNSHLDSQDLIPVENLRKYIAYARKYVHPKLSSEAASILQEFYIDLRKHHQSPHSTPITNRQLESMIRLTEARARLELREECTADDAQQVVDIMKYSMVDTYSDEFGNIDFERSVHGSGMSRQSKVKKFLGHLTTIASRQNSTFFTKPQMESIAKDIGMDTSSFGDFVENLNYQGFLIKKGPKLYQLQSV